MSDKEIIVLVGISGSGKTTLRNELLLTHPNYAVHSWDALRQEFYRRRSGKTEFPAEEAFQYIAADEARNKEFRRYAETVFANLLRREVSIIVDNTNISPKRRQRYVDAARAYGYKLRAYVFNTPLEVCLERQKSRGPDTWVPESSVLQQYSLLDMGGLSKHFQSVTYIPNADGLDLQGINRRAGPTFNIYDSEQLRDWVIKNPKLIRINESRKYPGLKVLKYSALCDTGNHWDYAAVEMRGLVVDDNWKIVAHPFTKLAAEGQRLGCLPGVVFQDPDQVVDVGKKYNGFMAAVSNTEKWGTLISTTGSLDSSFVTLAQEMLGDKVTDVPRGYTYLYEICHPQDPHIVPEAPGAFLLASRKVGPDFPWAVTFVPQSRQTVQSLRDELHTCRHEGYVVQDPDSLQLVKMKSRYYSLVKLIARCRAENVNRLVCDTDALARKFGEDLLPFYQQIKTGIIHGMLIDPRTDEQTKVKALRLVLDQVYEGLP